MSNKELPPLPKATIPDSSPMAVATGYSADQMRDYARAALAAQPDAPASDWPDVSPAGLRKMAEIAAPNNGRVFRAAADEIERLSNQPVAQAWRPLDSAPRDGTEFVVRYTLQGNVKRLIRWNTLHGFWESKGEAAVALEQQKVEWAPLPGDTKITVVVSDDLSADKANLQFGEAYGVDWVYASKPVQAEAVDILLREVFKLCEATEEAPEIEPKNEHQRGFDKGRRFEAKGIRRAIGDWFQSEFCGRSFMGEPVVEPRPPTRPPHCVDGACTQCTTQPPALPAAPTVQASGEREAFEEWAVEQPRVTQHEDCFATMPYGERRYTWGDVQSLWLAWQARAALSQSAVQPLSNAQFVKCIETAGFKTWDSRMWSLKREIEASHGIVTKEHS